MRGLHCMDALYEAQSRSRPPNRPGTPAATESVLRVAPQATGSELLVEMSRSDRKELKSHLATIMQHMLKLEHLPHLVSYNQRIWKNTLVREQSKVLNK